MSTTILPLEDDVYKRLHVLSDKVGQSPGAVLAQALADYEQKLLARDHDSTAPRTSTEAELLDDPGRIRMAPRDQQAVLANVVSVGRRPSRTPSDRD